MSTNYHTAVPISAAADPATLNSPLGELDNAVGRVLGSGTSYPLTPTEGDRFWRTDSNKLYVYNGSTWIEISTGGASAGVVDAEGTAGEDLAERARVYLDVTAQKWKKVDIDASPIAIGAIRGFVAESGGILNNAVGTIRISGVLGGFTGLTAGGYVYSHTTAGGYTQTKPAVAAGGAQQAIDMAGQAISTTEVLIMPAHVVYAKRASLANNATLTIAHHTDASTRTRVPSATIVTVEAGASLESYADTNRDIGVPLRGPSGAGATTTVSATDNADFPVGDEGGTDYVVAQSFQVTAGRFTQFTFKTGATLGSPTGVMTWKLHTDNAGAPSTTILATGTLTPTASAVNTINFLGDVFLAASTTYHISLAIPTQATNNAYNWLSDTTLPYGDGSVNYSVDGGTTWTPYPTADQLMTVTTSAVSVGDKLSQSFQVTGAQTVGGVKLYLKKVGTPAGTMTLRVETNNAGDPSGTLVDAAATTTLLESTLGTSDGWIAFSFASAFNLAGSTTYHIVVSTDRVASAANYVLWGADQSSPGYTSGEMKSQASSTWSAETKDACFDILGESTDYDEPCAIGRWSGGTRDVAVRYDDGSAASEDTNTTFKNVTGGTVDMTVFVRLP